MITEPKNDQQCVTALWCGYQRGLVDLSVLAQTMQRSSSLVDVACLKILADMSRLDAAKRVAYHRREARSALKSDIPQVAIAAAGPWLCMDKAKI